MGVKSGDRSVIYDELKRGQDGRGHYCPHIAQAKRDASALRSAANETVVKPAWVWKQIGAQVEGGLVAETNQWPEGVSGFGS